MAGVNGFNRGETLDVFLGMLDESELFHLFKEEMDNIRGEVISSRYDFSRFLPKYLKSLCLRCDFEQKIHQHKLCT